MVKIREEWTGSDKIDYGFSKEVPVEERSKMCEHLGAVKTWENSILGREKGKAKGWEGIKGER